MSTPTTNNNRILENQSDDEDKVLDLTLRPKTWNQYIGQERIKKNLKIILTAAQKRKEVPEHLLFYGGSGLGKTTISRIFAKEMGANLHIATGPSIEKIGDLASILTNLSDGDILFLDECHRINRVCEEYLYPAMEEFKLNIILGKGPMARIMDMKLNRFTLIGATTRVALLSSPLRNRFGAIFQMDYYNNEELEKIIQNSAEILGIEIEPSAKKIIAQRARFTPRVVNRLLKRVRDWAQVEGEGVITEKIAKSALDFLEIDNLGLETGDRRVIETIIKKFNGGPVGVQSLAAASNEDKDAILDIYEPYLMQLGFIQRTPRGRIAEKSAYEHLGIKYTGTQNLL
ncbi:Holliday junction branch migration DNA helicase RuvB [Candidatus Parcubacteria bacterium]|nr:Holliday junction branch migration DNA helicase RuvB [Candidatus Parcubacteria bacterium]